jgi:hypothetical protein
VGKRTHANDIHKEMFPVYSGKCLSLKAVSNWVEKFSQGHSKVADDARLGFDVAETTVKKLLCFGFQRTGRAMGQVYVVGGYIEKKIFFPGSTFACFTFYIYL